MGSAFGRQVRGLGVTGLMALCGFSTVSACLIEYDWSAADLPATVQIGLSTNSTLPIQEQIKSLEVTVMPGTIDETRQQFAALFADFDEQTKQFWLLASEFIRQQEDMQLTIVRNLLSAGPSSADVGSPSADSFSLVFSFPALPDLVLPLQCLGSCEGTSQSQWNFVRQVPEPAGLLAFLFPAAAVLGFVGFRNKPLGHQPDRAPRLP
jgi:hypothetical protein